MVSLESADAMRLAINFLAYVGKYVTKVRKYFY